MKEKRTITTTGLIEFCQIKYTRLHVWMENNLLDLPVPLPGAGHTTQFDFDDVVVAKVVTDLMRMCGNFDIAGKAVKLLRTKPRYRDGFSIIVSFTTTHEADGKFSEIYDVRWGSHPGDEYKKTDILFLDMDEEKERRSLVLVPVPSIMKSVKEFFNTLEPKEKQAVS